MNLYTVKDLASETYLPPFPMATNRDALDGFKNVTTQEKESNYYKYPADFVLMFIGTFDPRTGKISTNEEPIRLACGTDFNKGE